MSDADFSQVVSKFHWAEHQITTLHKAVTHYVNQKPYSAVCNDDPDTQTYRFILKLGHPPPAAISHIVGDVLNSLQGTLDYLAWQLALREGIGEPDFQTFFPIIKDANQNVADPRVNVFRSKATPKGSRIPLIADEAVLEVLRAVQPLNNTPDGQRIHPLALLSALNREAKHRYPAVLATAVANTPRVEMVGFGDSIDATLTVDIGTMLKDGDEVASIAYTAMSEGGVPENNNFPTFISLAEFPVYPRTGQAFPITEAMIDLSTFIDGQILTPLTPLF